MNRKDPHQHILYRTVTVHKTRTANDSEVYFAIKQIRKKRLNMMMWGIEVVVVSCSVYIIKRTNSKTMNWD